MANGDLEADVTKLAGTLSRPGTLVYWEGEEEACSVRITLGSLSPINTVPRRTMKPPIAKITWGSQGFKVHAEVDASPTSITVKANQVSVELVEVDQDAAVTAMLSFVNNPTRRFIINLAPGETTEILIPAFSSTLIADHRCPEIQILDSLQRVISTVEEAKRYLLPSDAVMLRVRNSSKTELRDLKLVFELSL